MARRTRLRPLDEAEAGRVAEFFPDFLRLIRPWLARHPAPADLLYDKAVTALMRAAITYSDDGRASFATWAGTTVIANLRGWSHYYASRARPRPGPLTGDESRPGPGPTLAVDLADLQAVRLDGPQREILRLLYRDGESLIDVGAALGMGWQAVRRRRESALGRLRA